MMLERGAKKQIPQADRLIVSNASKARSTGMWRLCAVLLVTVSALGCSTREDSTRLDLSVGSLLTRMTNVHALAEQPLGRSYLTSSYDRTGGNMDWAVWTETEPSGRITLLDAEGPGYVSRIWIASCAAKRWLFFFDGEDTPRLSLTPTQLFGGAFPFVEPLAGTAGGGRYSLVPIPFAKRLRIEIEPENLDRSNRNYYQINHTRLYDPGAGQQSWPTVWSSADSNLVHAVCSDLKAKRERLDERGRAALATAPTVTIPPGGSEFFLDARGPACIDALAVRFVEPVGARKMAAETLRNLRLRIWWDGHKFPSVDVPLGDFFCNPFYTREFASALVGRVHGVYVSRIPMPFRRGARVAIENRGSVTVRLQAGVLSSAEGRGRGNRYFHAEWRASTTSGEPFIMTETRGAGHYIGCFLTAIGQDGTWNILEGDESVMPDAGRQPVQFGTGLEDYFGGAYYYSSLFDLPFHGLIEKGAMRTDQYRFHALDAVDFDRDLKIGIEFGDGNRAQGYMSSVVYRYADRPSDCSMSPTAETLLARPKDRFELHGLMAMLFMIEREGLWKDAADRCSFFAERYAQASWSDLLRVRAASCLEKVEGFDAVRTAYERLTASALPPAARAAGDRLWLQEKETHALLGIHMLGNYRLWIDGNEIASGEGRNNLDVRRLDIQPGKHTWEVEFAPSAQGSFISLCLETRWGRITSAGDWETMEVDPHPGREPPAAFVGRGVLPNMTLWQFEPNGYAGFQSGAQCLSIWHFWDGRPTVNRLRSRQAWTNGLATHGTPMPNTPILRSRDEERAHAVD